MKNRVLLKTSKDVIFRMTMILLVIIEFLPFVNVVYPIILSTIKIFSAAIFYFQVLKTNRHIFSEFILILTIAVFVNLLAYYNCWINYTTFGSYMIKSSMCWVYMQIGVYLLMFGNEHTKKAIRNIMLLMIIITSITSLISLQSTPNAVRELGNGSNSIKALENMLYRKNTATWSLLYSMVFLIPYLINCFKNYKKIYILLIIAIIEFLVIKSQITLAIIISFCFMIFIVLKPISMKQYLIYGVFFILILLMASYFAKYFFYWLYDLVSKTNNEVLQLRVYQMYILASTQQMIGTIQGRFNLYMSSLITFLRNPILGHNVRNELAYLTIGLHSQIFDLMAATGIVGMTPLTISFFTNLKKEINNINNVNDKNFFLLTVILLLILMFLNPTYYSSCIYISVFWGPYIFTFENENNLGGKIYV